MTSYHHFTHRGRKIMLDTTELSTTQEWVDALNEAKKMIDDDIAQGGASAHYTIIDGAIIDNNNNKPAWTEGKNGR